MPRLPSSIGPYTVRALLADNDLTRIYRVWRSGQADELALKTFVCMQLTDPETQGRFRREALAGMDVRHPHVCRVHDFGYWQEMTPYIVLELLHGRPLSDCMDTPIALETAVQWTNQLLAGLTAIHSAGYVHRGLSPANLFVTDDGLKILDFGLARRSGWEPWTPTGASLGWLPYVAPEQLFDARTVDYAADLFVAGLLFYRAYTGRLPFNTHKRVEMLAALTGDGLVPLQQARPDAPAAVVAWLSRMLAMAPGARFGSAGEAMAALDATR